jgi:hypothetical protein
MGKTFPINLPMPDGSFFQGEAPLRVKTLHAPEFVLMGWLMPPDRSLEDVLADLVLERDQHEQDCAPWLQRLERAVRTQRFNGFWVYEPTASMFGLPDDASRREIAQAYRQQVSEGARCLLFLSGLYENLRGVPGCAPIGDLRVPYGWTHDFLKEQFELQAGWSRDRMLERQRNLPQRRQAACRSHAWFSTHHGQWIAIEEHRMLLNQTPIEALNRLPFFTRSFTGTRFYNNPLEAFQWLGTVKIDNPAEADWQITPERQPRLIPDKPQDLLMEAATEGNGRFLFSLLVDEVDLQNPAGAVSDALRAAGLRFSIRRFQQVNDS